MGKYSKTKNGFCGRKLSIFDLFAMVGAQNTGLGDGSAQSLSSRWENIQRQRMDFAVGNLSIFDLFAMVGAQNTGLGGGSGQSLSSLWEKIRRQWILLSWDLAA